MKSKITRKNRDRQGGHQAQLNTSVGSIEILPKMKKFIKQQSIKKIRRDHARALRNAEQEYQESLYQDSVYFWGYEDDSQYPDYAEWRDGYDDSEYDGPYSADNFYSDSDDQLYYMHVEPIYEESIVALKDVGKSLGQLLKEYYVKHYY